MSERDEVIAAYERGEFHGTDYQGAWNHGFDTTGLKDFQVWRSELTSAMLYDGTIELIDSDGHNHIYNLETKQWQDT